MRLAHKAIAASLLAAFSAGPVVAQSTLIEQVSFGHRRPWLGFAPSQPGCLPSSPGTMPFDPNPPTTANPQDPSPLAGLDPGAQRSLAGTGGESASAMPQSIGDVGSYYRFLRTVSVPTFTTVTSSAQTTTGSPSYINVGAPVVKTVLVESRTLVDVYDPVVSRAGAGFKIGDNESPRPMDRISFTYNGYFNSGVGGSSASTISTPSTTVRSPDTIDTTTSSTTSVPAIQPRSVDIHRAMLAFEKTFLDGNASVGIRLPVFGTSGQSNNDSNFVGSAFGDMTVIAKYALINDRQTNNLFSTGLAITFPTGPAIPTVEGNINSVLFQPFVGYIYNFGSAAYLQGFSSIVIPTNAYDVTVWFNDVGVGFVAFRNYNSDATLTAVIPTVECHITTPLNRRGTDTLVQAFDIVSMTGGVHFGLGQQAWLTLGCNAPMTGPRPYEVEAIAQFNYRY